MLPEQTWKLESVLRLLVGVFVCLCLGGLLALLVRGPSDPNAAPSVARIFVSAFAFQIGSIALIWRFLREHNVSWATGFGFRRNVPKAIGLGMLVIGLFLPIGWTLQRLSLDWLIKLGIEPSEQLALQALKNTGSITDIAALALITIVLAPLAEEAFFRGVLYPAIKQYGYPQTALWATSALFALIHFNMAAFIPLLLLALVLVWLYEKTGNLLTSIAAHVTFNAVNFAMFFLTRDLPQKLPTHS